MSGRCQARVVVELSAQPLGVGSREVIEFVEVADDCDRALSELEHVVHRLNRLALDKAGLIIRGVVKGISKGFRMLKSATNKLLLRVAPVNRFVKVRR